MPRSRQRTAIGFYGFTQEERTPRLLRGILEYRRKRPAFDLYHYLIDSMKTFENAATPPWKGKVDGVLIAAGQAGGADEVADWLQLGEAPAVTVVSNTLGPRLPAVITDPESFALLAVRELVRCQCRSLVFVGFRPSHGSQMRGEAFRRIAVAGGLPHFHWDSDWIFGGSVPLDPQEDQALAEILRNAPRPVGVHALNDLYGRHVLKLCEEHGLSVPGDVALVTGDNSPAAFERRPTISSINNNAEQVGYRAVELLDELIHGKRPPRKPVMVPALDVVVRETTGGEPETDDVVRALEIIRSKAMLNLKVQDLAAMLQVNRRTLERAFQERLGRAPAYEIQRFRMAAARELLRETEFSIARIAALVGYAEQAAFTNAFHRENGFSPKEFRNQPPIDESDAGK